MTRTGDRIIEIKAAMSGAFPGAVDKLSDTVEAQAAWSLCIASE